MTSGLFAFLGYLSCLMSAKFFFFQTPIAKWKELTSECSMEV